MTLLYDAVLPRLQDKKGREASPSPEEEARQLEEMRAAGLLGDGAGPSTAAAPQQDLAALSAGIEGPLIPGQTRRIRREILRDLGVVDGKKQYEKVKEIIYGGREKPYLLASLYQSPDGTMTGPWGFGKREVTFLSGARGGGKLTYAAARGKGMTRGRRGGRGGRGGRGSRGGRVASGAVRKPRGGKRGRRPKDFEDEELHDDDFDDGYHAPTYTGGERASRRVRVQKKIDEDHVEYIEGVSEEEEEVAISEDDVDVFEALGDRANGMEEDDIRAFEAELKRKAKAEKAAAAAANPKPKRQPPEGGARPKPKAKPKAKPQEPKVPKAPAPQPLDFREQFIKGDEMDDIFGSESPSEADNEGDEYVPEEMDSDDAQNQRRSKRRKTGPAASLPRQLAPGEVPEFTLDLANLNAAPIGWNLGQPAAGAAPGGVLSEREARRQGREQQRVVAQYAPQPSIPKNRPKRATQAKRTTYDFDEPEVADDSGDDSFGDYEYEDEEEFEERKPRKSTKAPAKKTMTAPSRGGGNVALNKIFLTVLKELKAAGDSIRKQNRSAWTYWHMFAKRVTGVSDYKKYVPAAKEMWLEKVQEQAKKNAYSNVEAFLADIRQIRDNAHAYNGPGGGKSRGGDIPDFVDGLPGFVENLLATKQIEIEAALAAPAVDWAPPAAPSRAATVLHIPEFSMDDFAPSASVQQVHSAQQEASVAQQPSAQTVPQMKVKLKPL